MLEHTTITITRAMIEALDPCDDGIMAARKYLPANISTDPDRNLDLACRIVEDPETRNNITWLAARLDVRFTPTNEDGQYKARLDWPDMSAGLWYGNANKDPMVLAQWLAVIADRLDLRARRKGSRP